MTHFSDGVGGYCAHCVLFSCIISTADAGSIRAESKHFLFFFAWILVSALPELID